MNKLWMTADLHFGYKDIISYENRPFKDVDDMNRKLIDNWNSKISDHDKLICMGDFSFCNKEITAGLVSKLKGYKILLMGNHDESRSRQWWLDVGFNEVIAYPIILDGFYILSHEPVYLNSNMPYINIHGHTHSLKYENKQYANVCVECTNYMPVCFDDIKKIFASADLKDSPEEC